MLGTPLVDSPCVPSGNPKFSPNRTSFAGSLGFVGWALLLVTCLGVGRPSGRLALRSLWKPQVFSPPHLCHRLFGFCWLGAPLGDTPQFWTPLWTTRLVFPLETPIFLPTACCRLFEFCWLGAPLGDSPQFLAPLWTTRLAFPLETPSFLPTARCQLFGFCWLGVPLGDSPCVPSRNPKFSPHRTSVAGSLGFVGWALLLVSRLHRTSVAGSLGFVGWALLLVTRLGFGHPSGRLALRSLWKPQVFSPPHLCRRLFGFCWLGAPLASSPRF
jgi:hypothetical protein